MKLTKELIEGAGFEPTTKHAYIRSRLNYILDLNKGESYFLIEICDRPEEGWKIEVVGSSIATIMNRTKVTTLVDIIMFISEASVHLGSIYRAKCIKKALDEPDLFKLVNNKNDKDK